jgi:hypothetical protein
MKCDEMTLVSELLAQDKQLGVTAAAAKARQMTAQLCSGNTTDGSTTAAGASVTSKYVTYCIRVLPVLLLLLVHTMCW